MSTRSGRALGALVCAVLATGCLKPVEVTSDSGIDGAGGGVSGPVDSGAGGGSQQLATLDLSPASLTVPVGASAALRVTRVEIDGTSTDVTDQAEFRAEPQGVVQVAQGRVQALAAGTAIVIAKVGGLEARSSVAVPAAAAQSLEVSLSQSSVVKGALVGAAALAHLNDNSVVDVSQAVQWVVNSPAGAPPIAELAGPGSIRALNIGTANIVATLGSLTASADLTIRDAHATSLLVTPAQATLALNASLQLTAMAHFDDGTDVDVTSAAQWSSSAAVVTVDAQGRALAKSAGSATLTASFEGLMSNSTLTVSPAVATSLTMSPTNLTLAIRGSAPLKVTATYSDGTMLEVTSQATFVSSAPAVATVSSSGTRGVVTAITAGSSVITARFGSLSTSVNATVTAAALQMLRMAPEATMVAGGATTALRALAIYSDGSQTDATELAVWSSDDVSIATVSNAAGSKGLVRGGTGGSTFIRAQLNGVRGVANITVQAPTLTVVEVAPRTVNIAAGSTTQLRAMAWFSDNTSRDVTEQAQWQSLSPTVATVSNAAGSRGLVSAVANGQGSIRATFQGQAATGTVVVQAPTLTQLSINPGVTTIPLGVPTGFEATVAYSDGTTEPVSDQVQWSTSDASIATVALYQGYAYLQASRAGSITVTATLQGVAPATARVTITSATLTRIDITPAQPTVPAGTYEQLTATGLYSDLSTLYLNYLVSWVSSDPSVVSVSNGQQDRGWLTALKPGSATVTATYNGVSASTVVTVTAATLREIQVTPFQPRLPVGFDVTLHATGLYTDNTTRDLTWFASWTSSAPAIATVGSYANLDPLMPGTATITATFGGMQGTLPVTVTNATLTSVIIGAPSTLPLAVQETRQLTARGTFSDGSMMDVTQHLTWLSTNPSVTNVSNAYPDNGQVKGLSAGQTSITAVRGTVTGSASVTVQ